MKTHTLLTTLNVLTWIVFIALLIKAGTMLFLYGYSLIKPDVAGYLYKGLDLLEIRRSNMLHYSALSIGLASLPAIQAVIALIMIRIFSGMNLQSPFTMATADRLRLVSFLIVGIWGLTFATDLMGGNLTLTTDPLFTAGLTYLIAQIFRRGVEMQTETELTV